MTDPIERSSPATDLSEQGLREQIEILWNYHRANAELDSRFIRTHAPMLVQLADELRYSQNDKSAPT